MKDKFFMKKKNITMIFLVILALPTMAFSNKNLQTLPIWLQSHKAFSNASEDEKFFFLKCEEKKIRQKYYIGFIVYSYSKINSKWRIWRYDQSNAEFYFIEQHNNLKKIQQYNRIVPELIFQDDFRNKRILKKINEDNMFWVIINSNDIIKEIENKNSKYILIPRISERNQHQRNYFLKDDLYKMELIKYDSITKQLLKEPQLINKQFIFNNKGFLIISDKIKEKPESSYHFIKHMNKVLIKNKEYYFFKNYGYVNLNAYFVSDPSFSNLLKEKFITYFFNNQLVYSPVYKKKDVYYFSCQSPFSAVCLWEIQDNNIIAIGSLISVSSNYFVSNKRIRFKFEPFQISKNKTKIDFLPATVKWLSAIKESSQLNYKAKLNFIEELCANSQNCKKSIQNLQELYSRNLIPSKKNPVKKHFLFNIPNSPWIIKQDKGIIQLFTDNNSKTLLIKRPEVKKISKETIHINHFGKAATYLKIPINPTQRYYYQQISLKKWLIIDDFMDPNGYHSIIFKKFKLSDRCKTLIQSNYFDRFDLIQGSTIKSVNNEYRVYNSYFPKIGEIEVLSKLEKYHKNKENEVWELHLLLAEYTGGFDYANIIPEITKQLMHLNIESIHIWEFCDSKNEYTPYNQLFNHIQKNMNIMYKHHYIFAVNQFYQVIRNQ